MCVGVCMHPYIYNDHEYLRVQGVRESIDSEGNDFILEKRPGQVDFEYT